MTLKGSHSRIRPGGEPLPDYSPEARRRVARETPEKFSSRFHHRLGRGSRAYDVIERMAVGTWNDGFIHAGNFAYMTMVAIFPFFILGAAALTLLGGSGDQADSLTFVLGGFPPTVRGVIKPVAEYVMHARSGWLLWAGALVGLWTTGSLVETIRDVLRRAYGTAPTAAFWRHRINSTVLTIGSVVMLMLSLFVYVIVEGARHELAVRYPDLGDTLSHFSLTRVAPVIGLFGSIHLLFLSLTPTEYRGRRYPKWPGALLITIWIVTVTIMLPRLLKSIFAYNLNYGSLAGIMIALFFFWLVGLGMVAGAELNAALAVSPEEEEADK